MTSHSYLLTLWLTIFSINGRVRFFQFTASSLLHVKKQISNFERIFEGIALFLNSEHSPAS